MDIKVELAPNLQQSFTKETEIAVEDIITPLKTEAGAALTVVFDSADSTCDRERAIQNQFVVRTGHYGNIRVDVTSFSLGR